MHVSLDNINFYSHAPAKPPARALLDSCWRPYNFSVAPQTPPNALPSRQNFHETSLSTSGPCLSPSREFRDNVRKNLDASAGKEFDIEIGRAMVQNSQVMHETGCNIHFDSALRQECHNDAPQSDRPSLNTDHLEERLAENPPGSLDTALVQAEPQLYHPSLPVSPAAWLGWDQDSISEGTCDQSSAPPEVSLSCAHDLPSPLPDLPLQHSIGTIMQDVSGTNEASFETETNEDPVGVLPDRVTTIQTAEVDELSISQTVSDQNTRGRSTESKSSDLSRLELQPREAKRSASKLAAKPCLRPRPIAKSTRSGKFPSVSVIIPARGNDKLSTRIKKHPSTRLRSFSYPGDSETESSNLDRDIEMQGWISESSTASGGSNLSSKGCARRRPKRTRRKVLAPRKESVRKSNSQSQPAPDAGLAVTADKSQEIFGRGILRVQAHGPRHVYFMTFLPEISLCTPKPSPSETSPEHPSRSTRSFKTATLRQTRRSNPRQRDIDSACENEVGESNKTSRLPRRSSFRENRCKVQQKPRRGLRWSSQEVDYLRRLRSTEQRPWSEVARLFSDRYPGRSPGAIQVYWSTVAGKD